MRRRFVTRLFKLGVVGSFLGGSFFLLQQNNWNFSSVGAVRFGRAAYAALRVALDYKFAGKWYDPDDPEINQKYSDLHLRSALRLREMCCANGGAFIKVGQHLSSLEYLLPMEYINTMKVLHDRAPESKLEDLYQVIEEDLGQKVEDLFTSFEPRPLGAASLAQVHRATLKDGQVVAVKVQHPLVKMHSFIDMKTMEFLVHMVAWMFPEFQYIWLAEETKKNLPKELDFIQEGQNCERVAKMFKKFDFLKIPKIYWDLSSERVLTMEFCEGGKVDDLQYMQKHGIPVSEVTRNLGKLYSEMVFVQGYVHCDPHPGNVFVNKTLQGTQIILLDHGLYQTLTDDFRVNYAKLWISLIHADLEGIKKYSEAMNCGELYGMFACMLTARSWKAVRAGIDKHEFSDKESQEIKATVKNYFVEITQILNRVPRQMLLILKTNDVLRGIEASLKARANATSFLNMSRCCVRALAREETKLCHGVVCRVRVWVSEQTRLFKISLYEFYLWWVTSPLGIYLSRKQELYS